MSSIAKSLLYIKQNNLGDGLIKFKNSEYIPFYLIQGVLNKENILDFNKDYFGYYGDNEAFVRKIAHKIRALEACDTIKHIVFQAFVNSFQRARNNGISIKMIEGTNKVSFVGDMARRLEEVKSRIISNLQLTISSEFNYVLRAPNNSPHREREDNILNRLSDYQGIRYTRLFKRREYLFNRGECLLTSGFCAKYSNNSINVMYCLQVKRSYVKDLRLAAFLEEPIDYSNFVLLIHPDFDTPKTQSKQMRKFYRKNLLPEYKELGIKIVKDKDIDNTLFDIETIPAFRTINEYTGFLVNHSNEIKKLIIPEEVEEEEEEEGEYWDDEDEHYEEETLADRQRMEGNPF